MSHRRRHVRGQPRVEVLNPEAQSENLPPLTVTMLGAGQEVGRSCCVIQHRGKTIVCDAGLHPAYPGLGALPFIDELDWKSVDAILVTQ
jgi:cleavage and polyadenylation specificity factor subunit 3